MEPAPSTPTDPTEREDLEQLGEQIAIHAARITAATYELLRLLRDFDQRGGWYAARTCGLG